jgi:hypothetical protein
LRRHLPVRMVGSKKVPPSACRLPPKPRSRLCQSVRDMLLDFGDGFGIDQRSLIGHTRQAVADPQLADGRGEFPRKLFVHTILHQQAVGADARLTRVAVLAGDGALNRSVEIGIVEYDERRIAAKLERQLLHRAGALRHQFLADLGRSGERDFAHRRVGGHFAADGGRRSRDHVEDALRDRRPGRSNSASASAE